MNVLFVTQHYLHGNGGSVFASRAYVNAFAEIANHVTLLYPDRAGFEIEKISPVVEAVPVRDERSKTCKMLSLIGGKLHRYYGIFETILVKGDYDVVVFDNSRASFGLIDVAHRYNKHVITMHHNCEQEYIRDNGKGLIGIIDLFWTKRQEREAVTKSDLNLTITRQDIDMFANLYLNGETNTLCYLGCFEYERTIPMTLKNSGHANAPCFVITGNLSAVQTEQSLYEWLKQYYPILRTTIPDSRLVIAGKKPGEQLRNECALRHIDLIPSPESMEPVLADADVYLCPINLGGGLKLRIMDGLKNGLPVIAHKMAARGYDDFVQAGYILTYDSPSSFAECLKKVVNLRNDKQVVQKEYMRLFSFDAGVQRMRRVLLFQK